MSIFKGLANIFNLIIEEGEKEYTNETPYMEMLNDLYFKLNRGDITEEKYEKEERKILKKLKEIREYKKSKM